MRAFFFSGTGTGTGTGAAARCAFSPRAALLIDEAREMRCAPLSKLRLLASARFDSGPHLCVIRAGDRAPPKTCAVKDSPPAPITRSAPPTARAA